MTMLRVPLLALVSNSFILHFCVHGAAADTNSFTYDQCGADCATASPAKAEVSLMQRTSKKGMRTTLRDFYPVQKPFAPVLTDDEALFALAHSGDVSAASATEIARWELEAEELAERLEKRRSLLTMLHARLPDTVLVAVDDSKQAVADNASQPVNSTDEHVIVPVPYYMHKRDSVPHVIPTQVKPAVAGGWRGDIIGDALDPTPHTEEEAVVHAEHNRGHVVILFLFGCLVVGSILQMMIDRWAPAIPYTCGLFIIGCAVSWVHWYNQNSQRTNLQWTTWYVSVDMWLDINPHLLFYVFLPALLMGDVMRLKVQLVATCFWQIFILACPGVIMGTCLIACFGRYLLPYGWDWPICIVFGSILSATDPVAVVSLFNTLGVSPRLTMLISGESLVNDGTAIVCFTLALKLCRGAELDVAHVTYWFLYMIIPAIGIGCGIGFISIALIGLLSNVVGNSDAMIQVIITLCCGYLSFFIAENEFSSSGVIATVTAGLTVAHEAWPLFVSRETVHIVWEAIEFVGNTVIFFLAGVIFTGIVLSNERHFGVQDFLWLLALYLGMFLIRAFMMAALWLPLNMAGQHITWQEGVAMVWSGLRGAVSLAMGMIVDIEPDIARKTGSEVMFHVGGIAALTLIVNACTSGPLLRYLGLVKNETLINRISSKLSVVTTEHMRQTFERELHNPKDERFFGANADLVREMVPMLDPQSASAMNTTGESPTAPPNDQHRHLKFLNKQISLEWKLVQVFREVFLRVVHSRYWQGIQEGVMPSQLNASRVLLHSTDKALDSTATSLKDWDIIAKTLKIDVSGGPNESQQFVSRLVDTWPFRLIPQFQKANIDFHTMMTVFVALSYIEAHTFAQAEISMSLGRDDAMGIRVRKQVIHESTVQLQKAVDFVSHLPPDFVELAKSQMLARRLLRQYITEIEHKQEAGFLTQPEADHLCHPCKAALTDLASLPINIWRDRLPSRGKETQSGENSVEAPPSNSPGIGSLPLGDPEGNTLARDPTFAPHGASLTRDGSGIAIVDASQSGLRYMPQGTDHASLPHRPGTSPALMARVHVATHAPHLGLAQLAPRAHSPARAVVGQVTLPSGALGSYQPQDQVTRRSS